MTMLLRKLLNRGAARAAPAGPHRLPPGLRLYAVGDVHGRLDLLRGVEEAIAADGAARHPVALSAVILLGDYIDRGPDSAGVIAHLLNGRFAGLPSRCLMGNHEDAMLRFLDDSSVGHTWFQHGGLATLASYGVQPAGDDDDRFERLRHGLIAALPAAHRAFLSGLDLCAHAGDYLFAHAGIRPGRPMTEQTRDDLLMIREPFLGYSGAMSWRVVHGHTISAEPEILPGRIGIDTGAYASGRLTCAMIEDDRVEILPDL